MQQYEDALKIFRSKDFGVGVRKSERGAAASFPTAYDRVYFAGRQAAAAPWAFWQSRSSSPLTVINQSGGRNARRTACPIHPESARRRRARGDPCLRAAHSCRETCHAE